MREFRAGLGPYEKGSSFDVGAGIARPQATNGLLSIIADLLFCASKALVLLCFVFKISDCTKSHFRAEMSHLF